MPLNGTGQLDESCTSLIIEVQGRPYKVVICRIDGNVEAGFAQFQGAAATEGDVKGFLPNWQSLNWTHGGPPRPWLPAESRADDVVYRVHLMYGGGGNPEPEAVVNQFLADLA